MTSSGPRRPGPLSPRTDLRAFASANRDLSRRSLKQTPEALAYAETVTIAPERVRRPEQDERVDPDRPWVTIVWNDPINLQSYVTWVFQKLFGYSREKATKLMLDVHNKGRAVVSSGQREAMELDVARLHAAGLWATLQQD
jgi:ATP-dependent Clp protease adaptor protein ClpS